MLVGDDAGSVVVREQRVVEGRKEARRGRGVGVRKRCARYVEQLASVLVAKGYEPWPETLEDLPQTAQTRPRPRVGDGGRAEGLEVAQKYLLGRGGWIEGTTEPGLGRGPGGLSTLTPDPARRYLNQRRQESDGIGERERIAVRPPLCQQHAQLGPGVRTFFQEGPSGREELVEVQALQLAVEGAAGESAGEDRLDDRA